MAWFCHRRNNKRHIMKKAIHIELFSINTKTQAISSSAQSTYPAHTDYMANNCYVSFMLNSLKAPYGRCQISYFYNFYWLVRIIMAISDS